SNWGPLAGSRQYVCASPENEYTSADGDDVVGLAPQATCGKVSVALPLRPARLPVDVVGVPKHGLVDPDHPSAALPPPAAVVVMAFQLTIAVASAVIVWAFDGSSALGSVMVI